MARQQSSMGNANGVRNIIPLTNDTTNELDGQMKFMDFLRSRIAIEESDHALWLGGPQVNQLVPDFTPKQKLVILFKSHIDGWGPESHERMWLSAYLGENDTLAMAEALADSHLAHAQETAARNLTRPALASFDDEAYRRGYANAQQTADGERHAAINFNTIIAAQGGHTDTRLPANMRAPVTQASFFNVSSLP